MSQGPNAPYTQLDDKQVIQRSFDEANDRLRVAAEVTATIGTIECVIDASSGDNIAIASQDGSKFLAINPDGSLNVNVVTTTPGTFKVLYEEADNVSTGITEVLIDFNPSVTTRLVNIDVSGTNIATYEILKNSALINKKRTYFGAELNAGFNFDGLILNNGDNLKISVVHNRPDDGDFNATLQYIEI